MLLKIKGRSLNSQMCFDNQNKLFRTYIYFEHFIGEHGHLVSREHIGLLLQPELDTSNKQCPSHKQHSAKTDQPLTATCTTNHVARTQLELSIYLHGLMIIVQVGGGDQLITKRGCAN